MGTKRQLTISELNQKRLAAASGLSCSAISRILSSDPKQRRSDPSISTLQKLQRGLKAVTRRSYSIEEILSALQRTGGSGAQIEVMAGVEES